MATTPIVEIPVSLDDSKFKQFAASFTDYGEKLKEMPAEWQAVQRQIAALAKVQIGSGVASEKAWANASKAAHEYERIVKQASTAQQHLGRTTTASASAMHKMERSAKAVSGHLFSAVRMATKLGVVGIGGGLLGLGGLTFGLDRLGEGVLSRQRTARGLGLAVGQYRSFQINMQRYAGTQLLAAAANAQANPAVWGDFPLAGIPIGQARNESPARLAEQMLLAAHQAWRRNPSQLNPQITGLERLGMSLDAIRTAGAASPAGLRAAIAATRGDVGSLSLTRQMQRRWSNFEIQLQKAGAVIQNDLIKGLVGLTGPLGKLSKAIEKDIQAFFKSGAAKDDVQVFAKAIGWAANELGSGAFKKHITNFVNDMDISAKKLHDALVGIGWIPTATAARVAKDKASGTPAAMADAKKAEHGQLLNWMNQWDKNVGAAIGLPSLLKKQSFVTGAGAIGTTKASYLSGLAASHGLQPGLLSAVYRTESGGNDNAVSTAGAEGGFQFMPATARRYGVANPFDFGQASRGAARMLAALERQFHGNLAKALAAYNWGPANVRRDVAAHGAAWRSYLPHETQDYVAKVEGMLPRAAPAAAASTTPAAPRGGFGTDMQRIRARILAERQRQALVVTGDTAGRTFTLANMAAI